MFTKNWYAFLNAAAYGFGSTKVVITDYAGLQNYAYCESGGGYKTPGYYVFPQSSYSVALPLEKGNRSDPYIRIGSGTTPATLSDYSLEAPITNNFSVLENKKTIGVDDDGYWVTYKYVISNVGDNDMVIGEIGYFGYVLYNASAGSFYLIDRTVLDTPITIPAGGTGTVTYTLKFKVPAIPTE